MGISQRGELPLGRRDYRRAFATTKSSAPQVKQRDKVGRPDIDQFEAVMMRENCERGFFIGFDFSSDAEREVERFWKQSKRLIKLLTVQEILDEEVARKIA